MKHLLWALLLVVNASAFDFYTNPVDGTWLRWRGNWPAKAHVKWTVEGAPAFFAKAMKEAAGKWADALDFQDVDFAEDDNNPNVVVHYTDEDSIPGLEAYTVLAFDSSFHTIIGADIYVNPIVLWQLDTEGKNRIRIVLLHELGHVLGLAHSTVSSAIMYPSHPSGSVAELDYDDWLGIRTLYSVQ